MVHVLWFGRRLLDQFKIALPGPQTGPGPPVITGG
jgi:hypothetical protein